MPASVEDSSCLKDYWFCCTSDLKSNYVIKPQHDGLGTSPPCWSVGMKVVLSSPFFFFFFGGGGTIGWSTLISCFICCSTNCVCVCVKVESVARESVNPIKLGSDSQPCHPPSPGRVGFQIFKTNVQKMEEQGSCGWLKKNSSMTPWLASNFIPPQLLYAYF